MDETKSRKWICDNISDAIDAYEFDLEGRDGVPHIFLYHTNDVTMAIRDEIYDRGYDKDLKVIELDKKTIRLLKKYKVSYKDWEQKGKDLKRWWWHLDKIQQGTYPPELLPDYLREEYFKLHPHLKTS